MELILTAYRHMERELLEEMRGLGNFWSTCFQDVIKGEVEDLETFLQELERKTIFSLSKITPILKSFRYSPESVIEDFKEAVKPFIDMIKRGETFCVRVVRRGFKGVFSSQHVASELGTFIFNTLKERDGEEPKVDLENPDKAVVFETLRNWCGVGIIHKEMRRRYFYLKLP